MKPLIAFLGILLLLSCQSNTKNKQNPTEEKLHIMQTDSCQLSFPSLIAKVNDSCMLILNRYALYRLNLNNGKLESYSEENLIKAAYEKAMNFNLQNDIMSFEESRESVSDQQVFALCMNKDASKIMYNLGIFEKSGEREYTNRMIEVIKTEEGLQLFFDDDELSELSQHIALSNSRVYFSDSLIIAQDIQHYDKNNTPELVEALPVYRLDNKSQQFVLRNRISYPYDPENNRMPKNEDELAYLSYLSFTNYHGNIYFSPGKSIFKLNDNFQISDELKTAEHVKAFHIRKDTVFTIEKDSNKQFSAHTYNLNTKKELKAGIDLPDTETIMTCRFIENELYLIFKQDDEYYLQKIKY